MSKLDKPFYPAEKVSKGDVIDHYQTVAGVMLPHLAGRPLTLRRYPDGIGAEGFVQQDASGFAVDWLWLVEVPRRQGAGTVSHVVREDAAMLVYLANQVASEFHIWPSTVDNMDRPDRLVIDVDPPDGVEVATPARSRPPDPRPVRLGRTDTVRARHRPGAAFAWSRRWTSPRTTGSSAISPSASPIIWPGNTRT